jgi:hypothetical protein
LPTRGALAVNGVERVAHRPAAGQEHRQAQELLDHPVGLLAPVRARRCRLRFDLDWCATGAEGWVADIYALDGCLTCVVAGPSAVSSGEWIGWLFKGTLPARSAGILPLMVRHMNGSPGNAPAGRRRSTGAPGGAFRARGLKLRLDLLIRERRQVQGVELGERFAQARGGSGAFLARSQKVHEIRHLCQPLRRQFLELLDQARFDRRHLRSPQTHRRIRCAGMVSGICTVKP